MSAGHKRRTPGWLLCALAVLAGTLASVLAVATPAAFASGNDYPYASVNPAVTPADPWGFGIRQCTSFVAWRLHQHGVALTDTGFRGPDGRSAVWGNASNWAAAARADGYRVGTAAVAGAVAQWDAGESAAYYSPGSNVADGRATAGPEGHVAWVISVYPDGSALVEQYNAGGGDLSYSQMRVRAPRYLYIAVKAPPPTLAGQVRAGRSAVPAGAPVGIYAKFFDPAAGGAPAVHRPVRLYARVGASASFVGVASAYTSSTGVAGFGVRVRLSTAYRACVGSVCSGVTLVRVLGAVAARLAGVRSHVAVLSGGVRPAAGQRVYLLAPHSGRWRAVRATLTAPGGGFGFRVAAAPVPYLVYLPATADSGAARSAVVRVP